MTRAQLRTSIQAKGFGSDGAFISAQNEAINAAYRRVAGEHRWPWLERLSTSLTTIAGNSSVSLTPITDLMWVDAVRLTDGTSNYDLTPLADQDLRSREHEDRFPDLPVWWAEVFGEIRLYPIPDKAYTVVLDYLTTPPELGADGDSPLFDTTFHDILVWGAISDLAFRERDYTGQAVADKNYDARLRSMMAAYGIRQRHGGSRVAHSRFWDWV